jgi:glycosyltransferase involved in cell wall biosynthesis
MSEVRTVGARPSLLRETGSTRGQLPTGLTIIIPNWNHRSFLPRSIRSARQALAAVGDLGHPGEVLIFDDASRDGSSQLLRSLAGLYGWDDVATVFLEQNVGAAAVRNLGIEAARYSHILFLDADNEVFPLGVATLLRAAIDTGAALCYGNLLDIRAGAAVGIRSNDAPTLRLTEANTIDALALVDTRQGRASGGFSRERRFEGYEDHEFLLHLISEERELVFVPTVVGYYHLLPLSMVSESETSQILRAKRQLIVRIFSQAGTREWDTERVGRIYHPDLGYLDEGWS